jgi:PAS domain S-box-containing protein
MQPNAIDNKQSCKVGFSLSHKALLCLVVLIIAQIAFACASYRLYSQLDGEAATAFRALAIGDRCREVVVVSNDIAHAIMDAVETGNAIDGEWLASLRKLKLECLRLETLLRGDEAGLKRTRDPAKVVENMIAVTSDVSSRMKSSKLKPVERVRIYQQLESFQQELSACLDAESREQDSILEATPYRQARLRDEEKDLVMFGGGANVLLLVILGLLFKSQVGRRLAILKDSGLRVMNGHAPHPPTSGWDEIAILDNSVHAIADSLEQVRRQQQTLIENANDVICTLDRKGLFTTVGKASTIVFGYDPEELVGSRLSKLIMPDDQTLAWTKFRSIAEGGIEAPFEARLIRKDGKIIDVLWSATWMELQSSIFCLARDVTDRRDAERLRQEVLQMASHDLRTPMVRVRAFLDSVDAGMMGELDHRTRKLLLSGCRDLDRMLTLINDLVDVERAEAGTLELVKSYLSLAKLFELSVEAVAGIAAAKDIVVDVAPVDLAVYADATRLEQIMVNLLTNAIKFAPQDSTVTVSANQIPGFVEIRVTDQGPAIPERVKEKIFNRFQQVRELDSSEERGGGLGLTMCKVLVDLHGGDITVAQGLEAANAFVFRIPIDSSSASIAKPPKEAVKPA